MNDVRCLFLTLVCALGPPGTAPPAGLAAGQEGGLLQAPPLSWEGSDPSGVPARERGLCWVFLPSLHLSLFSGHPGLRHTEPAHHLGCF